MSGWEASTRRSRLPKDWPAIRARILKRDDYRCTWVDYGKRCDGEANQVDHIQRGDNHDPSNLRALCAWHHARKTGSEGGIAARGKRLTARRPPERHPGLLP